MPPKMKARILVVEDDERLRNLLLEAILLERHEVAGVGSAEEALERLAGENFDILITDVNLPGKSGLDLLPLARQLSPDIYMLVITAYATIDAAVRAMKSGATDFLTKPVSLDHLLGAIRVGVEKISKPAAAASAAGDAEPGAYGAAGGGGGTTANFPLVAHSSKMLSLLKQVETVAPFKASVLITGETGTGKELVARALHQNSPRAKRSLVALNCAAIPEQLLEAELFGHVKGAFTGAQTTREGRLEQADGGTLFLDEIGDMNLALQSKLLRVLQESEFEKLGSSRTVKIDVRVIAATSADLERKIAEGLFRADLYHRLNVVRLSVPTLRERPDDILPLADFLLNRFCRSAELPAKTVGEDVRKALLAYDFPGNVRQLQNCMERAAIFSGMSNVIHLEHLPEELKNAAPKSALEGFDQGVGLPKMIPDEGLDFNSMVSRLEREVLMQTLNKTGGNKMRAAKLLNMKRTTLVEKLKRLQIETPDADEGAEEAE